MAILEQKCQQELHTKIGVRLFLTFKTDLIKVVLVF